MTVNHSDAANDDRPTDNIMAGKKKSAKKSSKKSGKKPGKKSGRTSGKTKSRSGSAKSDKVAPVVDIMSGPAMENLHYIAHNVPDALEKRGFSWPDGGKKKKGGKGGKKKKKKKK